MRLLNFLVIAAFLMPAADLSAGGSVGGGTGMILELETQEITSEQFKGLVLAGWRGERVLLNGTLARVRAIDFQEKTVEIGLEETQAVEILQEATAPAQREE